MNEEERLTLNNYLEDLYQATANGYESDRNLCRSQLDSLTQDYERLQNE